MSDLVALIIGIAHFPHLPDNWRVDDDRTANDAIAVTEALVERGVDRAKIKLFLSAKGGLPPDVAGVVPEEANKPNLENFFEHQLGDAEGPFIGSQFLFFWSGHGASAKEKSETLLITADSLVKPDRRIYKCLGIEDLRSLLQRMPRFKDQLFCINACRTPAEWAFQDYSVQMVSTFDGGQARTDAPKQARFFAAKEFLPSPVQGSGADGSLSNGFAAAVIDCIRVGDWPPRAADWRLRLKEKWRDTEPYGIDGPDYFVFKRLYAARHSIDREPQCKLVQNAFKRAKSWNRAADLGELWRGTMIDLHARTADCLHTLIQHLEDSIFKDKSVAGGVQRVAQWPRRELDASKRKKILIEELTYGLVEDRTLKGTAIVEALIDFGTGMRVVYVDIDGPCRPEDGPLVKAMLDFWQGIIVQAQAVGTRLPHLPLLLVGHVEPDASPTPLIDTTGFYHPDILADNDERRLNTIGGNHLHRWIGSVLNLDDLRRPDVELEFATALGRRTIEEIKDVRMGAIIEIVKVRASLAGS